MGKYFGTDGIRGKAEKFDSDFLSKLIWGLNSYATSNLGLDKYSVMIGGDTRESTEKILADLAENLNELGVKIKNVGVLPTPGINYVFYTEGFDFAIDVTASHNPSVDNGIKIFERGECAGKKLSDLGVKMVEAALDGVKKVDKTSENLVPVEVQSAQEEYLGHLLHYVGKVDFSGLKIGLDLANGATSVIGGDVFRDLGAEVSEINRDVRYGHKINNQAGSTHIEGLVELVKSKNLDCGAAFDGDGDRCLMVDEEGKIVDGDEILAILANFLHLEAIVSTITAGQGFLNWGKEAGIKIELSDVGDQNVAKMMKKDDIKIGGEQSGHIILPGEAMGDGILTALMVVKVMSETKKSLHELASVVPKLPQVVENMKADEQAKNNLKTSAAQNLIKKYADILAEESGRILVRPSGTEELIRITMWGEDEIKIKKYAKELEEELKEVL